jgi:protein ImuB
MKRYVSIWLPDWPIERISRRAGQRPRSDKPAEISPRRPFALVAKAQGGVRIMAPNDAAKRAGVMTDQLLADARALCPILNVADHDPAGDQADLHRLARWCIRYSPWVASDAPEGILMDVSGCAHLFGGEEALARDVSVRLKKFGFRSRIGIAKTIGAAWAVSRYGDSERIIVNDAETAAVLSPLPIVALRLGHDMSDRLEQVGLKTIGALIGRPRAPFAARYGVDLIKRLDQALGHMAESLSPVAEPPDYRTYRKFPEPILLLEQVQDCLVDLAGPLADMLKSASSGARCFDLSLYRVDGDVNALIFPCTASMAM